MHKLPPVITDSFLMLEWDYSFNNSKAYDANKLTLGSHTKAGWICQKCNHKWMSPIKNRYKTQPKGCPECWKLPKIITNEKLMQKWDADENNKINLYANELTIGSGIVAHWHHKQNNIEHKWTMRIADAVMQGCSVCAGRMINIGVNDLLTTHPELSRQIHPIKNGDLRAEMFLKGSHQILWWLGACGHEWDDSILHRTHGAGCPVCSGKRIVANENDLLSLFPLIAKEFHPTENGDLKPEEIAKYSNKKFWWLCDNCNHVWGATVTNRTYNKSGCPNCCQSHTELEKTFEKLMNCEKYNKKVLINYAYKPDFKKSDNIFVNTDGLYWHTVDKKGKNYHFKMREAYETEGKQILQFYEDEIYNQNAIVQSIINNKLGKINNKIMARKCTIQKVNYKEAKLFFNTNHLMQSDIGSKCIGLYFNKELVCAISYKKKINKNCIEISRFGSKINNVVVGGFSKLLKELEKIAKEHNINKIISFCDLRYATGKSYEMNGFKRTGVTLGWCWTDTHLHRFNRLKCKATKELTEAENAKAKKWFKIYDAGQAKYEKLLN